MAVISKDLGPVTAYAAAVNRGYTGTREEFETLMASYATVAEEAAASASDAIAAKNAAISAKNDAATASSNASTYANRANTWSENARNHRVAAHEYADAAEASATAAQTAQTAAEAAQAGAETAVDGFDEAVTAAISDVNTAGTNQKELAKRQAEKSEAWAVGEINGEDVGISDPAYHNNSKYYAEQTAASSQQIIADAAAEKTAAQTARQGAETAENNANASAIAAAASAADAAASAQTLVIDDTLTGPGQAADAKVVGSRFSDLSDALDAEEARAKAEEERIEALFTQPVGDAVEDWLDDHPEATTTVQDESLTYKKLVIGTLGFVTPEMFGAVGDGTTDDSLAVQSAINYIQSGDGANTLVFDTAKTYVIREINIDGNDLVIDGKGCRLIFGESYGFRISKDSYNITFKNINSEATYTAGAPDETFKNYHYATSKGNTVQRTWAHNLKFENLSMNGGVFGIVLNSTDDVIVDNCRFYEFVCNVPNGSTEYGDGIGAGGYGLLVQSCIGVTVVNCNFINGRYNKHAVYISVDRSKDKYIINDRIYINNCYFNNYAVAFFAPSTVPINVRYCREIIIENSKFEYATGAISFNGVEGNINATIRNIIYANPVYNSRQAETKTCINVLSDGPAVDDPTEHDTPVAGYIHLTLDNAKIDDPTATKTFATLKNCVAKITNCTTGKGAINIYDNVEFLLENFTTYSPSISLYFFGEGECIGKVRNVIFKAARTGNFIQISEPNTFVLNADCFDEQFLGFYVTSSSVFTQSNRLGLPFTFETDSSGTGTLILPNLKGRLLINVNSWANTRYYITSVNQNAINPTFTLKRMDMSGNQVPVASCDIALIPFRYS